MNVKSVVLHLFPVPHNIIKGCSSNGRCQPSSCILAVLAGFSGSSSAISSLRNVLNVLQFFLSTKSMQPHRQGLSVDVPFSRDYFVLLTYFSKCPKSIPNLANASWLWRIFLGFLSQSATEKPNSFSTFWKKKCICQPRYRNISKNFFNNLILANKERALAVRSSVFDHLTSKVYDAKQIVHRLQETLEWNQASLEQPNREAKKWIRSLTREARRSERLDVVKYLREITPAGTTGECVFCSSVFLFLFFSFFSSIEST